MDKETLREIKAMLKRIRLLTEALIWCSGSEDFQEGGKARKGWIKICKPLLDNMQVFTRPYDKLEHK